MGRKVAGDFLHVVSAFNTIKIAVSDFLARVRYQTENKIMYRSAKHICLNSFNLMH